MAEQIAQNPAFAQMSAALQASMAEGTQPGAAPGKTFLFPSMSAFYAPYDTMAFYAPYDTILI